MTHVLTGFDLTPILQHATWFPTICDGTHYDKKSSVGWTTGPVEPISRSIGDSMFLLERVVAWIGASCRTICGRSALQSIESLTARRHGSWVGVSVYQAFFRQVSQGGSSGVSRSEAHRWRLLES